MNPLEAMQKCKVHRGGGGWSDYWRMRSMASHQAPPTVLLAGWPGEVLFAGLDSGLDWTLDSGLDSGLDSNAGKVLLNYLQIFPN